MDGFDENVAGVEEQEATAPATQETEPENPTVEGQEVAEPEAEPTADGKTEEDARFANVRRRAEEKAKAKYDAEIQRWNSEVKSMFGGYSNPRTGKPIETVSDYIAAIKAQEEIARENELREKGVDPQIISEMVNNNPVVQQANAIMQLNLRNEADRKFNEDLKELGRIDPSIKTEADLVAHPSYQQICNLVSLNGLSIVDAYKLANFSELSAKQTAAAKQAAVNQAKGKNHLEATRNGMTTNTDLVDVPASLESTWKMMDPSLTDEQIRIKYNEFLKKTGGK